MDRAIELINGMMKECDAELDKLSNQFSKTNPHNIYDASYRETLVRLKDIQISRYNVLRDVKKVLEGVTDEDHE